jgi:hypothetical protein
MPFLEDVVQVSRRNVPERCDFRDVRGGIAIADRNGIY